MFVACSAAWPILLYGTPSTNTRASRTTNPRVSVTRQRPVTGARDRISVGSNCTCEMTSRFGSATLEAGIDVSPPGRRMAPAGLPGGSGFVRETTTGVGCETAEAEPSAFVALTRTRTVLSTSAVRTRYVDPVSRGMFAQLVPSALQRRHWKAYVIAVLLPHSPLVALSV